GGGWGRTGGGVETLMDGKKSANVMPGRFEAKGSDCRADRGVFIREVDGLKATDEQLASIEAALRANELQRKAMIDAEKAKAAEEKAKPAEEQARAAAEQAEAAAKKAAAAAPKKSAAKDP